MPGGQGSIVVHHGLRPNHRRGNPSSCPSCVCRTPFWRAADVRVTLLHGKAEQGRVVVHELEGEALPEVAVVVDALVIVIVPIGQAHRGDVENQLEGQDPHRQNEAKAMMSNKNEGRTIQENNNDEKVIEEHGHHRTIGVEVSTWQPWHARKISRVHDGDG